MMDCFTLDYVVNGNAASMYKVYQNGSLVPSPISNHYTAWDEPASVEVCDILVLKYLDLPMLTRLLTILM